LLTSLEPEKSAVQRKRFGPGKKAGKNDAANDCPEDGSHKPKNAREKRWKVRT
jgi:hypothetical protein